MDRQLYQYHPVIGYHFIPNLKVRVEHEGGGYLVRVNSRGFRCEHEFEERKGEEKTRLLLFGDSFTAGEAVSNKHRYGDVLETLVPGLEVYNFALPGTGTDQHYLTFREIAKAYEHDLVVIGVQVENIRRVAARLRLSQSAEGELTLLAKPYFELDANDQLTLHHVPVPRAPVKPEDLPESERAFVDQGGRMLWLRQLIGKMGGRVKDIAQQVSHYQPLPEYDDPQGREWLLMKAILRQWTNEITKPVIIMPIPLYQYIEETASADGFRARFAELKDWPGVTVHDIMPDYYTIPKEERRSFRFEKDIHPTPAHHRFLAESLERAVRQKLSMTTGAIAG